jgi:hypothetical protein
MCVEYCYLHGELTFILFSLSHSAGPYRAVVSCFGGVGGAGNTKDP